MRLCLIWNLHQPNSWHPARGVFELPWTRIQTLSAYLPLLQMAKDHPAFPFTVAISPDVLWQLDQIALAAARETLFDIVRKPAAELREAEIGELVDFAFVATPHSRAARFPAWEKLWDRWTEARGVASRFLGGLRQAELRDLQSLVQLGWIDVSVLERAPEPLRKGLAGEAMSAEDAHELADLQLAGIQEFLHLLRDLCRRQQAEYLGTPLHRAILPLLSNENDGIDCPEDLRAQIVRGPRVHYQNFGLWPPVLHLPEGALCERSAMLVKQACLDLAVANSRVLERSLGRSPSADELTACWDFRGRSLFFSHSELSDQVRFVYPHLPVGDALTAFWREVATIAESRGQDEGALVVEIDASIAPSADPEWAKAFWLGLMEAPSAGAGIVRSGMQQAFEIAPRRVLSNVCSASRSVRGLASWSRESHPRYWKLLNHAREQFQNVRAWKTLSPEALSRARHALLALESVDWISCMEPGLDAFTQRKMEELLRAHFELVYRRLEVNRHPALSLPFYPCETRTTSIAPSQPVTPILDGKRSSYHSWIGSGFYRSRQEGGCPGDPLRQINGVQYGEDGSYAYLRVSLPIHALRMLAEFEIQGVFHAIEGEQSVSWFRISQAEAGAPKLEVRLAVPPASRDAEQPLAAVDEVVDLRIPLSALGVQLGEMLRFQVSLWEKGNAVASAPPLGWEEFEISDQVAYEEPSVDARISESLERERGAPLRACLRLAIYSSWRSIC